MAQLRPGRNPLLRQAHPERPGTDPVTREAYAHEVISLGFWPGGQNFREPAFYSYTTPEPEGLSEQPLRPPTASCQEGGTALLTYEEVRKSNSPKEALLEFLESAYGAGAKPRTGIYRGIPSWRPRRLTRAP